jgi:hypothetical protein
MLALCGLRSRLNRKPAPNSTYASIDSVAVGFSPPFLNSSKAIEDTRMTWYKSVIAWDYGACGVLACVQALVTLYKVVGQCLAALPFDLARLGS